MSDTPPDPLGRTTFDTLLSDGTTVREVAPGQYVCDFCLTPDPSWKYPCGPVRLANPDPSGIDASDDPWLACDRCHGLIDAGRYEQLVSHCAETQARQKLAPGFRQLPRRERVRILRHNVREFARARQGDARPYAR